MPFAAVAFTVVLALLAAFQLALIAGAPLGHFAWGGQDRVLAAGKRIGSVVSILLYAAFAMLALDRADVVDSIPAESFVAVAMWVVFGYLALGIAMNAISRSRPERFTMTPVAALLAVLALLVALG